MTMPFALLRCYARMLGRIEAAEMLRTGTVTAYGTGNMEKKDAQMFAASMRRATGERPPAPKADAMPAGRSFGARLFGGMRRRGKSA